MKLTDPVLIRELDTSKVSNNLELTCPKVKAISNITFEFLKSTAYDYSGLIDCDELVKKSAILDSKIILTTGSSYDVYDFGNKWVLEINISAHKNKNINHYKATEVITFPGFLEIPSWVFSLK